MGTLAQDDLDAIEALFRRVTNEAPPHVVAAPVNDDDVIVEGPNEHGAVKTKGSLKFTPHWVLDPSMLTRSDVTLNDVQKATICYNCGCDEHGNIGHFLGGLLMRQKLHTHIVGLTMAVVSASRDEHNNLHWRGGDDAMLDTLGHRYTASGEETGPVSSAKFYEALAAGVLQ